MRKVFFLFLFYLFTHFLISGQAQAFESNPFSTQITSQYVISDDYGAVVVHEVSSQNLTEYVYAPFFGIEVEGDPNEITVLDENSNPIPFELANEKKKKLRILFENKNSGIGKIRRFKISYKIKGLANKKGALKEVYIPGLEHTTDIAKRKISVITPVSWGKPSISKPAPSLISGQNEFVFEDKNTLYGGVFMIFGSEQFYELNLIYNIKNPNIFPAEREIALPPATTSQDVVIKNIYPSPQKIHIDPDGNWLASYLIPPNESITVKTKLLVRTHLTTPSPLLNSDMKNYTKNDHYWESSSKELKDLAESSSSPREISEFVVETLFYVYGKSASDKKRFGALGAIRSPEKAVCLEYSDLFIGLARAKGIPARSIEGYAFSDDPTSRPLSLIRDVLHAWPEYYDLQDQTWKAIDPTWTDTTGGLDYFSSLDFDHIAFVIKGRSSRYPIPAGAYKIDRDEKNIQVRLIEKREFQKQQQLVIIPKASSILFTFLPTYIDVLIKNSGDSLYESGKIFLNSEFLKEDVTVQFPSLAPGEEKLLHVRITPKSFLTKGDYTITMRFGGDLSLMKIKVTPYPPVIWLIVGGIFSVLTGGIIIVAAKARHIYVFRRKGHHSVRR